MIAPMTRLQKVFAYSTLVVILAWAALGIFAIWLMLTE